MNAPDPTVEPRWWTRKRSHRSLRDGPWSWMTWADLACIVAEDAAELIDPRSVDHLLWEHTAWPMDTPAGVYRRLVELLHDGTLLGHQPCGCAGAS